MNSRQNYNGTSDDTVSVARAVVEAITELRKTLANILGVVSSVGTFTTTGVNPQVIQNPAVQIGSVILLTATGTGSGAQMAGPGLLVPIQASFVPGVSFNVQTADGSLPAIGSNIRYVIHNPLS